MERRLKRRLVTGAVVGLAVAGGGGALAATQLGSPKEESQAVVNDAAKQLGISPTKLSDALKKALENRVDAAVTAGDLTKEQGDALKARIESGELPLVLAPAFGRQGFGPGFGHHGGLGDELDAAATYLGLTAAELQTQVEGGKTLAQVAKDKNKSVDGLIDALVAAETKELDAKVTAGELTKEQEQTILPTLKQRFTDLVNGTFTGPPHDGFRGGDRFGPDGAGPGFGYRFRGGADRVGPPGSDLAPTA